MCDIGKPLEIIDVQPLNLPAPLRRETEQPAEQPATIEIPVEVNAKAQQRDADIEAMEVSLGSQEQFFEQR